MPDFDLDAALSAPRYAPQVCSACGGPMQETTVEADDDDLGRFTDEFSIWSRCDRCGRHEESLYKMAPPEAPQAGWDRQERGEYRRVSQWQADPDRRCSTCGSLTKIDFEVDVNDIKDTQSDPDEEGFDERYLSATCIEDRGCGDSWTVVYKFDRVASS